MTKFNLKGGGPCRKKAFENTFLFSVITEAIRFPHATELDVRNAIGDHFKQAPGRAWGGGYKNKI
ncbi:hypothetical protein DNTS_021783 [Danionella cerebrum]|uniref:Uncharacterized protein n=1 Tax=Danionella cerebrum TaxID=2873325 RepID=A0A553R861_9TELE|nr:hypothetical protein DNTS_021783 [Danionella translucida]